MRFWSSLLKNVSVTTSRLQDYHRVLIMLFQLLAKGSNIVISLHLEPFKNI